MATATIQLNVTKIPGDTPASLQGKIEEAFGELPDGTEYKVMSARVDEYDPDNEKDALGSVGVEIVANDDLLIGHFGETDAEDQKNEEGFSEAISTVIEKVLNSITDAEFEVEDVTVEMDEEDSSDDEEASENTSEE